MDADRLVVDSYEAAPAVQVVRASGQLSSTTVPTLRTRADEALAHQPDILVVDLFGVVLLDPPAARVLSLIAAQASVWPVTRVAVTGAAPDMERASRRFTGLSPLIWSADSAARAARLERPVIARQPLPRDLSAVATARRVVAAACPDPPVRERAEIVVTELVGNAVQHADGPLELRVVHTGRMHLSVRDGTPDLTPTESGYGLDVVRTFAVAWGWGTLPGGKVVWAAVGAPPRAHRPVRRVDVR